ncbi:hypothetical protein [Sphingobium sp. CECT 9361]|uniref:hypothetical protein n=1 Tax=Sphingobium sp. CECT 9361 TaxID=2845384 RepID=UPI001E383CC8|nr:hypothetical protein [Sphingobium sp. CECT 9361]CAH0355309.1 hypothetical protein SPH9361_03386 [Sphingobium sp. CECT 9361]
MSPDPKAAILALATEAPLVPLDGVEGAFIRTLSIDEVDQLADIAKNSGIVMLTMAIVDDKGVRLFDEKDVIKLRKLRAGAFNTLSRQVTKVNNMGGTAAEDLVKN